MKHKITALVCLTLLALGSTSFAGQIICEGDEDTYAVDLPSNYLTQPYQISQYYPGLNLIVQPDLTFDVVDDNSHEVLDTGSCYPL